MKKLILLPLLTLVFSFTSYANNTEEIATATNATTISTQESVTSCTYVNHLCSIYKTYIMVIQSKQKLDFISKTVLLLGLDPGYDAGPLIKTSP